MHRPILMTLFALGLSAGLAGQGMGHGPRGGAMPLDDAGFPPTVAMLTTMLGLSPEQVAAIAPHRDSLLLESKEQRASAAALRQALREASRSGASADSVAALRQRLRTAMLGLMPYRMAFHAKVRALVTPEQAKIMDDRQQEMLQQMQRRHDQTD
ncbi:MAG: Spy/CpxP family protein refolding chaperone [Gemmatimonadota bacterium]|nr:Spy/CpxP family protein refolding chaperone [Gemmatimonadota bacterium]